MNVFITQKNYRFFVCQVQMNNNYITHTTKQFILTCSDITAQALPTDKFLLNLQSKMSKKKCLDLRK